MFSIWFTTHWSRLGAQPAWAGVALGAHAPNDKSSDSKDGGEVNILGQDCLDQTQWQEGREGERRTKKSKGLVELEH
eukprot:1253325-Amphidinium_carterae.2